MKKRYFIELSFMGSRYHGWQIQTNALTLQQVIEEALSNLLKENISITGAGRTDTGVHASYFVAHFDSESLSDASGLKKKLNRYLHRDILVYNISGTNPDAHARYDAVSRTYKYVILRKRHPFLNAHAHFFHGHLDLDAMRKATSMIMNTSDFSSFAKLHSDNKTNVCKIYKAEWVEVDNFLVFIIEADRFLRNMVRALTGTIMDVGKEKISPDDFHMIIESRNNQRASASAPATGLYLFDISYPGCFRLNNPVKNNFLPFL